MEGSVAIDSLTIPIGNLASYQLDGLSTLVDPLRTWVLRTIAPLAKDVSREPSFHIRFDRLVAPTNLRRIECLPLAVHRDELYAIDARGRIAILDPASRHPFVGCDARLGAGTFVEWVLLPLVQSALLEANASIIHASAAEVNGHRVAIAGACGSGKSMTLLWLLQRGANLLADDCIAIGETGMVAPLQAALSLSDFHWRFVPAPHHRSIRELIHPTLAPLKGKAATHTRIRKMISIAEATFTKHTNAVQVQTAFPRSSLGSFGNLDTLAVLVPRGAPLPEQKHVPEILAMHAMLEFEQSAKIEAIFRSMFPDRLQLALFPSVSEHRDMLEKALKDVKIAVVHGAEQNGSVTNAIASIRELID